MIDVRSAAMPRAALEKAVSFLIERQSGDGAWRDFQLKPGRSDAWVTAYVGLRLLRAETCAPDAEMRPALAAATRYLEGARHRDGGWGYNGKSPPDADSTAQSILFLRAGFGAVTLADYAALARFQLRDGAFATYRRGDGRDGWCRGHPDVTAVALRAMAGMLRPDHVRLRRGYARLAGYLARKNALASYWWPSPFYLAARSARACVRCRCTSTCGAAIRDAAKRIELRAGTRVRRRVSARVAAPSRRFGPTAIVFSATQRRQLAVNSDSSRCKPAFEAPLRSRLLP